MYKAVSALRARYVGRNIPYTPNGLMDGTEHRWFGGGSFNTVLDTLSGLQDAALG